MRAHGTTGAATSTHGRSSRRFREAILDFFSPTLTCEACGTDTKMRRCSRTGESRPVHESEPVYRVYPIEVEFLCPACGGSIWYLDASAQYPYPLF